MTPQEWKLVEEKLKNLYDPVKLKCDGYDVTLSLVRIEQFKNGIAFYVNRQFLSKWIFEDCEERRRFCRPVNKSLHTSKQKQSLRKLSKRLPKGHKVLDPDAKYTYYAPYWTSFKALKSHLIKNNSSIELVRDN